MWIIDWPFVLLCWSLQVLYVFQLKDSENSNGIFTLFFYRAYNVLYVPTVWYILNILFQNYVIKFLSDSDYQNWLQWNIAEALMKRSVI